MKASIKTYQALTDIRSKGMGKSFQSGEEIKAPSHIGSQWVKSGYAKEIKKPKTIEP